jgi:hypothetical protein
VKVMQHDARTASRVANEVELMMMMEHCNILRVRRGRWDFGGPAWRAGQVAALGLRARPLPVRALARSAPCLGLVESRADSTHHTAGPPRARQAYDVITWTHASVSTNNAAGGQLSGSTVRAPFPIGLTSPNLAAPPPTACVFDVASAK